MGRSVGVVFKKNWTVVTSLLLSYFKSCTSFCSTLCCYFFCFILIFVYFCSSLPINASAHVPCRLLTVLYILNTCDIWRVLSDEDSYCTRHDLSQCNDDDTGWCYCRLRRTGSEGVKDFSRHVVIFVAVNIFSGVWLLCFVCLVITYCLCFVCFKTKYFHNFNVIPPEKNIYK